MRSEKSAARREALRLETLKSVYKVLAVNLGTPPQTFSFRFEDKNKKIVRTADCTPLSFFRDFVGENLDDYFVCYSIPNRAFYRLYEVELDKAVDEGPSMRFINLPIAELKELGRKSVLGNDPVWFGCDVGKDSYGKSGLMIPEIYNYEAVYDIDLSMSRLETFLAYSNVPTHAMVFTGIDIENGKISKWLVENSWGKDFGNDGHYYMADDWFDQFVQMIVIHRKYLPQKLLEIFTTDPELLPPWDPMYKRVN
jgi:bleomycin hydrolase